MPPGENCRGHGLNSFDFTAASQLALTKGEKLQSLRPGLARHAEAPRRGRQKSEPPVEARISDQQDHRVAKARGKIKGLDHQQRPKPPAGTVRRHRKRTQQKSRSFAGSDCNRPVPDGTGQLPLLIRHPAQIPALGDAVAKCVRRLVTPPHAENIVIESLDARRNDRRFQFQMPLRGFDRKRISCLVRQQDTTSVKRSTLQQLAGTA